ncbi:UTP--glucose-1-phosphate uridylyltransferase, partial [Candidatus Omnitrophota bacterium]
ILNGEELDSENVYTLVYDLEGNLQPVWKNPDTAVAKTIEGLIFAAPMYEALMADNDQAAKARKAFKILNGEELDSENVYTLVYDSDGNLQPVWKHPNTAVAKTIEGLIAAADMIDKKLDLIYKNLPDAAREHIDNLIRVFTIDVETEGGIETIPLNLSDGIQPTDIKILLAQEYGIIYDEKGNIRDVDALFKYWAYVERFEFLAPRSFSDVLGITVQDLPIEARLFLKRSGITNETLLRGIVTYTITGQSWTDYSVAAAGVDTPNIKLRFYAKPQLVGGREVNGLAIFDFGATTSLLGWSKDKMSELGYSGDESLRYVYYSDSDNRILIDFGVRGYMVETDDKIQGHENWGVIEEITTDGDFVIARAIGDYGKERATITRLIEGGYLVTMITEREIMGDENPDLLIYKAYKNGDLYNFTEENLHLSSYIEKEFSLNIKDGQIYGLDSILDDLNFLPDSRRSDAEVKLIEGLLSIKESLGLENEIHIVKERVEVSADGIKFNYRVKEDPWARIVIFVSSDVNADTVVNTKWSGESSILGYKFTQAGLMFKLESAGLEKTLEIKDILDAYGLDNSLIEDIKKRGITIDNINNLSIVQIDEKLLIAGKEITVLTRYVISNDPLYRDYARYDRGVLRFIKFENGDKSIPFGISRGEVVISPEIQRVIRETKFDMQDEDEYIYRVIYEYRDGNEYKNEPIFVGYNYKTGVVWEHYVNEEWKLYSRDGLPITITRIRSINSTFPVDASYSSLIDSQNEYLYSNFEIKIYIDASGNTYLLITENILSPTPVADASRRIIRNNQLWAITLDGFLRSDVYAVSGKDKFFNSIPGRLLRLLGVARSKDGETVESLFNKIKEEGTVLDWNYELPVGISSNIFVDKERQILNLDIDILDRLPLVARYFVTSVIAIVIFVFGVGIFNQIRSGRKDKRNLNFASFYRLRELLSKARNPKNLEVEELSQKTVLLRELNGPAVIGKNIPSREEEFSRRQYLLSYLSGYGFSEEEADLLIDLFENKIIEIDDKGVDPRALPRAPQIDVNDAQVQLDSAIRQGYPKAMVIQALLDNGLISQSDLIEVLGELTDKNGALKWYSLANILIRLTQNRVLEEIKAGNFSRVNALIPTPEARTLKYIRENNIVSDQRILRSAQASLNFTSFIMRLISQEIIEPIFEDVFSKTFDGVIHNEVKTKVLNTIVAMVHKAILKNPNLIGTKGQDIVFNPYPMNKAIEPLTVSELVILKLLQLPFSFTDKHSLSQLSSIWPFALYTVRKVNDMVKVRRPQAEILDFIYKWIDLFNLVFHFEMGKQQAIVNRSPWKKSDKKLVDVFSDLDFYDLFERLAEENQSFEEALFIAADKPQVDCPVELRGIIARYRSSGLIDELADAFSNQRIKEEDLAKVIKEATLILAEQRCPEAAKADRRTRKRFIGSGLFALYVGRILSPALHINKYWGMNSRWQKIGFFITLIGLIGAGVYLMFLSPYLAIGTSLIALGIMVSPLLWGKSSNLKEKLFWTSIFSFASLYVFGLMAHHVFWKLALLNFTSYGFWFTLGLVSLTLIPTIISFYHLAISIRSYWVLNRELWSNVARSLVGLKSFIPWFLWKSPSKYWEGLFKKWHRELKAVEQDYMPLLPNGESLGEYFEGVIRFLSANRYLTDEEATLWLKALREEKGGRFVKPASNDAFRILYDDFKAISQKKPLPDVYALLEATNTHVQGAGEIYTYTWENAALLGTFDANPKSGEKTTLLGYLARNYGVEWKNLMDYIEEEKDKRNINSIAINNFIEELRQLGEYKDINQALLDTLNGGLTPTEEDFVDFMINTLMSWLNEIRPSDAAVIDSIERDYLEYHLYTSYQLGDLHYHQAVKVISQRYSSLQAAYVILSSKAERNATENAFVTGYNEYQYLVDFKLRQIFQDMAIWAFNGNPLSIYDKTSHTFILKEFNSVDNIIKAQIPISGMPAYNNRSINDWAEEFLAWRAANYQAIINLLNTTPNLRNDWNTLCQIAFTITRTQDTGIICSIYSGKRSGSDPASRGDHNINMGVPKNAQMANNLWLFYNQSVNYDAHVRIQPGQNVWRFNWAALVGRNPHIAVTNPMMRIWASGSDAFPATKIYAIAQEVWTSDVQRTRRGSLTAYGKMMIIPQMVSLSSPPGEDSSAFLRLQASNPKYTSEQIDFYEFLWGRPSLLAESIVGTETRYAYNVTRFLSDRGQFELFFNKDLSYDKKLSHLFLFFHYLIVPFSLTLLIILPLLAPFSAFAFLTPFLYFVLISFLLMEAINSNNFIRHWRQTGNFWMAAFYSLKDIIFAFPMYVFLLPFFFRGILLASSEIFSFIRTQKEALLQLKNKQQRWDDKDFGIMLLKFGTERGIPLSGILGLLGLAGWTFGMFMMMPYGAGVILPYLLASIVFLTGMYNFGVFVDRKGNLKGYSLGACLKMLPYSTGKTLYYSAMLIWDFLKWLRNKISKKTPPTAPASVVSAPSAPVPGPAPQPTTQPPADSDKEQIQPEISKEGGRDTEVPVSHVAEDAQASEGYTEAYQQGLDDLKLAQDAYDSAKQDLEAEQYTLDRINHAIDKAWKVLIKAQRGAQRASSESDRFRANVFEQQRRKREGKRITWVPNPQTNQGYVERYQRALLALISVRHLLERLVASVELHEANLRQAQAAMEKAEDELDKVSNIVPFEREIISESQQANEQEPSVERELELVGAGAVMKANTGLEEGQEDSVQSSDEIDNSQEAIEVKKQKPEEIGYEQAVIEAEEGPKGLRARNTFVDYALGFIETISMVIATIICLPALPFIAWGGLDTFDRAISTPWGPFIFLTRAKSKPRSQVKKSKAGVDATPAPDRVVAVPAELAGFGQVDIGRVTIRGRDNYEFQRPEALSRLQGVYQERLRQIIGFVSHNIKAPPIEVNIIIEPVLVGHSSAWYETKTNTLHIQAILLIDSISDIHRRSISNHEGLHISSPRMLEDDVHLFSSAFLIQDLDLIKELYDFFLSNPPIELRKNELAGLFFKDLDAYTKVYENSRLLEGLTLSLRRLDQYKLKLRELLYDIKLNRSEKHLIMKYLIFGKASVFAFWNELEPEQKRSLLEQMKTIDLEATEGLYYDFIIKNKQGASVTVTKDNLDVPDPADLTTGDTEENLNAEEIAAKAFQAGEVAILELAGGSGSRLGYRYPKIRFKASQVMNKSLARMRAEKIRAMAELYGKPIPWFIMTSDVTHAQTVRFFEDHIENGKYFNQVPKEWVRFIPQRVMPQITQEGEFVLGGTEAEAKDAQEAESWARFHITVGGFGHGDARDWVLKDQELMNWLTGFGVKYIIMANVDNAFLPHPRALGYHILSARQLRPGMEHLSMVVVEKTGPKESVGMAALLNGKDALIEYNQVPAELAHLRYIYVIDHEKIVFFKDNAGAFNILSFEDYLSRYAQNITDPKAYETWVGEHLVGLEELPDGFIYSFLGREYEKEVLLQWAKLWLRLGNTNTIIWSLSSFEDEQHPLKELPVVVRKNADIDGYHPQALEYNTKDSRRLKAHKFEIMAFHGFLVGTMKGARIIIDRPGGFAPIKNKTGVDTPQTAAELYSQYESRQLAERCHWYIATGAIVEFSPTFSFIDGRYLPERVGESGFVGHGAQLYVSGRNTTVGRNFYLCETCQFILRVNDEYNQGARAVVGEDVRVEGNISFVINGAGRLIIDDGVLLKGYREYIVKDGQELHIRKEAEATAYPATMPATQGCDRVPTSKEWRTVLTAFGGRDALVAKGITLNRHNTVISPALTAPAEVKGGVLYINPNTLRGPPEQLRVIFEGHELFHLLGKKERAARKNTIKYLLNNNLLSSHIAFLVSNEIGLSASDDWLGRLLIAQSDENSSRTKGIFIPSQHASTADIIRQAWREKRGYITQRSKTRITRGWQEAAKEDKLKLGRAIELLLVEHIRQIDEITLPYGLGEFRLHDQLDIPNIVLIQPRNNSPGLVVNDKDVFSIAHSGLTYNTIYIDKISFSRLDIQDLAALILHKIIEFKAQSLVLKQNRSWSRIRPAIHELAKTYELKIAGPSITGIGTHLDDSIKEILARSFVYKIQSLIEPYKDRLQQLVNEYRQAESKDRKRIEEEINQIVDKINVFSGYPEDEISLAEDVETLEEFLMEDYAKEYIEQAKDALIHGRYVPEFFFAGAATRLIEDLRKIGIKISKKEEARYRMYGLDIWDFSGVFRKDSLDLGLGMGPRQVFTYRTMLRRLAEEQGLDPRAVIRNQILVLHINEDIADLVQDDFLTHNFYGFEPENIFFIIQETLPGYSLDNGRIVFAKDSDKLPFGHGYATMQLSIPSVGFGLRRKGEIVYREYLSEDVITELEHRSSGYFIGTHRVNDLTKFLVDEVVDIKRLAFSIYLIEQGNNITVELVENPAKQKGGNFVWHKPTKKSFLIETSNTKASSSLDKLLTKASQAGAPYNAFRLTSRRDSLRQLLENELPYNLRFKNGYFYLEAVTGDITQLADAKVKAFKKTGEVIKDFKQMSNLDIATPILKESDAALIEAINQLRNEQKLSNEKIREVISTLEKEGLPSDLIDTIILSMPLEHTSAETVDAKRLQEQIRELYGLMNAYLDNPAQIQVSVKNPKDIYYKGVPPKQLPREIDYTEIMIVAENRQGLDRDITAIIAQNKGNIRQEFFAVYEGLALLVYEIEQTERRNAFNSKESEELILALSQIKTEEKPFLIGPEYRFDKWEEEKSGVNVYGGEVIIDDKVLILRVEKYGDMIKYFLTYEGKGVGYGFILFSRERLEFHYLEVQDWFRDKVANVSIAKFLMNIMLKDLLLKEKYDLSGLVTSMVMERPQSTPKVNNLIGEFGITEFNRQYVQDYIMDKESIISIAETEAPDQGVPYFEVKLKDRFPIKVFLKARKEYLYNGKRQWVIRREVYQQMLSKYTTRVISQITWQDRLKEELAVRLAEDEIFVGGIDYYINPDKVEWLEDYVRALPENPWAIADDADNIPARTKSGLPSDIEKNGIAAEINSFTRNGKIKPLTVAEFRMVNKAAERVKEFLEQTNRKLWIPRLEQFLVDREKWRKGALTLCYSAVHIHKGIFYLCVNSDKKDALLDIEPLQLELDLLFQAATFALIPGGEILAIEEEYVYSTALSEGIYELRKLGDTIKYLLEQKSNRRNKQYRDILRQIFQAISSVEDRKEAEEALSINIDELNLFEKFNPEQLNAAKVARLEDVQGSDDYESERLGVIKAILEGQIAAECVFAGAATRMGKGPLYGIDPWDVVRNVVDGTTKVDAEVRIRAVLSLARYDNALSHKIRQKSGLTDNTLKDLMDKTHYEYKHLTQTDKERFDKISIDEEIIRLALDTIDNLAVHGIGLGPRQLIQLRIALEALTREYNKLVQEGKIQDGLKDMESVIAAFQIVLHVNSQMEEVVNIDLTEHDFYGFNPNNIIIVTQRQLPGWYVDWQGNVRIDTRSEYAPYNHGWVRMQLGWKNQAYSLNEDGNPVYISIPVIEYLKARGVHYIVLHRINDSDRITSSGVLDTELISLSIYLMRKYGFNLTVELVGNPLGSKGGLGLRFADEETMFLLETLNARDKDRLLDKRFQYLTEQAQAEGMKGLPYNAMRQVEDIIATEEPMRQGLPVSIRIRGGNRIYIEVPVGDETRVEGIKARAVMRQQDRFISGEKEGELIHDFKQPEHCPDAIRFFVLQDSQKRFGEIASVFGFAGNGSATSKSDEPKNYPARIIGEAVEPTAQQLENLKLYFGDVSLRDIVFVDTTATGKIADVETLPGRVAILKGLAARAPPFDANNSTAQAFQLLINDIILHDVNGHLIQKHDEQGARQLSYEYFLTHQEDLIKLLDAIG